jgi:hypothetical protein
MAAPDPTTTLNFDEMFRLSASHHELLVDDRGRTCFDIFLTRPAEAVFDWPDMVDLPARYWEAGAMIDTAIGRKINSLTRLRQWLFGHFEEDGLAYRPEGPISHHCCELFDQSRVCYALVSWAMYAPEDQAVRRALIGLVEGLIKRATIEGDYAYIDRVGIYFGGTMIRPLLQGGLTMNRPDWIEFAARMARGLIAKAEIGPDGVFRGHVHSALSAVAGMIGLGVLLGDKTLLERGRAGFEYARSISTSFGFVPEKSQSKDDIIACETCTLMDYLDAALLLARHVDPGYWELVEQSSRNHLWESQVRDASWLPEAPGAKDEPDIIRSNLRQRVVGAFAGWSGPHCLLAYHEFLGKDWIPTAEAAPRYMDKIRALQNCCAGGGARAVYQVWSNIITPTAGGVDINLNMDRSTPQAQITSFLPFTGKAVIYAKQAGVIRWRKPEHVTAEDMQVTATGTEPKWTIDGPFVNFGHLEAGTQVIINFALPEHCESIRIGNPGYLQFRFDVFWRGNTVMAVEYDPANSKTGYSAINQAETKFCFAEEGYGPIYQRKNWPKLAGGIAPAPLLARAAKIDWYSLGLVGR